MGVQEYDGEFSETSHEIRTEIRTHRQEGRDNDAIVAAEESLHRCVVCHGASSRKTRAVSTDLVLAYNHLGMKLLSENNIEVGKA